MASEYSIQVVKELHEQFRSTHLHRPMRISRFDPGTELTYDVQGIEQQVIARVSMVVEKFIGGGFAGQVYKVKILSNESNDSPIVGLEPGKICALKILIPPSTFSRLFRDLLYWIGFQGPFQLQANPAAAKAGALWQKFARRAAGIRLGDENMVADIYAILIDEKLGGCGELREWVEGRTWRLEVDNRMDLLKRWRRGRQVDQRQLGSPEYRAKRQFMQEFVRLLHDIGAYEFARQYEWWTAKSQPNCLKRSGTDNDPAAGLVAVDFRAGLTLLPFLPMSPGDFLLIAKGIARASIIQFDRGNLKKLEGFVQSHSSDFSDMQDALQQLKDAEAVYRDSVPDITHNHVRLLYSSKLWSTMLDSAVTGWKVKNYIDERYERKLRASKILTLLFFSIGVIPFLGKFFRRLWARLDWRRHYRQMLTSWDYFRRAIKGRIAEKVIVWHRADRVDGQRALRMAQQTWRFWCHFPLSILPAKLHRLLTDSSFAKDRLIYYVVRPVRLYFNAQLREQWLREMVAEGQGKNMLSNEDASAILSQINEPFIQKYLKSLAVHLCTLPVTQIVSVTIAAIYYFTHRMQPNAWVVGLGIVGVFQVTPISPGSLVRGLYVLYLVVRERNFKDYNIAVFLGFFKYVGYLAFPIQMTYHYPALARFMAAHWATEAVHVVPVFGERGALLEHWVFCLFYNWPLTIRRRMRRRAELRMSIKPRYWHVGLCIIAAVIPFALADVTYLRTTAEMPGLRNVWYLVVLVPLVSGALVTLGCGGAALTRRILAAATWGMLTGLAHTIFSVVLAHVKALDMDGFVATCLWQMFIFAILSTAGAIATELKLPEPVPGN
jgi:hypothetical protein